MSSSKQVIVIVGASGGLGNVLYNSFSKSGYDVVGHYNENNSLVDHGEKWFSADLTDENQVKSMFKAIIEKYSKIDVLINAAGVSLSSISWKTTAEDWRKTIEVNLTAPFLCIKEVLPIMRINNFGRIINLSSVVAQKGVVGTSSYAASKSGLFGMSRAISEEVGNKNITINNIALGYFNYGMINDVPDDMLEDLVNQIPKKRLGESDDLIGTIKFLIGESSGYLTGQTINLNGGLIGN